LIRGEMSLSSHPHVNSSLTYVFTCLVYITSLFRLFPEIYNLKHTRV